MITVSHLRKNFGNQHAVRDVSLTIKPGEIIGLLGPNGAGKTTTIRMLAGVLPPTSGTIEINQKTFETDEYALKSQIGYLPENNPLYDELTVEEHLKFWGNMKNLTGPALEEAIEFAAEKTGITEVFYRVIGELSKGYRQRVGLAQAILAKPEILLLDEPTEGLDPNQRREIQQLLEELKQDRTVIVSSHVLGEISKLANRIVIIHEGKVVGDNTPKNLTKQKDKQQVIEVEVKGKAVIATVKAMAHVVKVAKAGTDLYQVTGDGKKDIRPDLFKLANKEQWTLLSVRQVDRQLEDVFTELTREKQA